ncbi:MAG: hypothetical protein RL204_130 [Bacteroidota bacterium]|jgi:hypothetical protein
MKSLILTMMVVFSQFEPGTSGAGECSVAWGLKFARNRGVISTEATEELNKCVNDYRISQSNMDAELDCRIQIRIVKNQGENDSVIIERTRAINDFFRKNYSDTINVLYRIENVEKSDIRFLNTTIGIDSVFGAVATLILIE